MSPAIGAMVVTLLFAWMSFTIGEGIVTGKVRKLSRYEFRLYDREKQPMLYWASILVKTGMAALFGWALLAYWANTPWP